MRHISKATAVGGLADDVTARALCLASRYASQQPASLHLDPTLRHASPERAITDGAHMLNSASIVRDLSDQTWLYSQSLYRPMFYMEAHKTNQIKMQRTLSCELRGTKLRSEI